MASVFESAQGLLALHQIVLAARFTFAIELRQGEEGQRLFLQRAGLEFFVACSKGSMGEANHQMFDAILVFGQEQQARLQREVAALVDVMVLPDEVFRQGPILMALEGGSGFLFVQERAEHRDAESWVLAWRKATVSLPIHLLGGTGDEAGGIKMAWKTYLGVEYFADLFHVQYEVSRGCGPALARQVRHARKALQKVQAAEEKARGQAEPNERTESMPGAGSSSAEVSAARKAAEALLAQTERRQKEMGEKIRGLGGALTPFDLQTGEARTAEQVTSEMTEHFTRAWEVAAEAKLGDKATAALKKAEALVGSMAAQVTFWHGYTAQWVRRQGLDATQQAWVMGVLLPVLFLTAVAGRAPTAEQRSELRARAAQWTATLLYGGSVWHQLTRMQQVLLLQGLQRCVGLWQRSSAAVEGCNGQVSRHNRALHSLPPKRLGVFQVMHNYATHRPDGTTAMERLFGLKPPDLFEWMVDHLPLPPRPSLPRKRAPAANPLLLD